MTGSNEFKLNQTPDDGISSVKFSPNTSQFLLVSSWDTTVRLYDVPANTMRLKYQHSGAVLDCAFYVSVEGFLNYYFFPEYFPEYPTNIYFPWILIIKYYYIFPEYDAVLWINTQVLKCCLPAQSVLGLLCT